MKVRIKKGVRPYGGKVFPAREHVYPNGRRVVLVHVDSTAVDHKLLGVGRDEREYRPDEVEVVEP